MKTLKTRAKTQRDPGKVSQGKMERKFERVKVDHGSGVQAGAIRTARGVVRPVKDAALSIIMQLNQQLEGHKWPGLECSLAVCPITRRQ